MTQDARFAYDIAAHDGDDDREPATLLDVTELRGTAIALSEVAADARDAYRCHDAAALRAQLERLDLIAETLASLSGAK